MRRIIFIAHGKFRGTKLEKEIRSVFSSVPMELLFTTYKAEAVVLVQQCSVDTLTTIVSVGGDGTLHDVVNGLIQAFPNSPIPCTLAVLPVGSGNDFARTIQGYSTVQELFHSVQENRIQQSDVLEIQCNNAQEQPVTQYCINVADVGLGGMVANIVNASPQWMSSTVKYNLAVLRSFFKYKKRRATICMNDSVLIIQSMSVCFANGKYFGSGLCIAPDAEINDGKIAVTVIGDVSVLDYIRYLPILRHGDKIPHTQVTYTTTDMVTVTTNSPAPIEADGEFIGYSPLTVTVLPNKISILINKASNT